MGAIKTIAFCIFICFIPMMGIAQSITVNDTYTAQNLVNILTNNSTCSTTSTYSVSGDTFSGTQKSYGSFNSGTSSFPFQEGILLSTWSISKAVGPFDMTNIGGGSISWKGDLDLEEVLGISNTFNATVLEFDFIPLTNFISFNYIFASNEYQSYFPCEYSDGFAFLIRELGTVNYTNLAVIPGTKTPISSKNLHPLINDVTDSNGFHKGCPPVNENYFGGLNTSSTNNSPINFSGLTKKLTAQTTVVAGKTYHIKLVIADQGGNYYDSAVFLEAGSFKSKIDLGSDRLLATNNGICFGESYIIDTGFSPSLSYTYNWYKDESTTPIVGENKPTLVVNSLGNYSVTVTLGAGCSATGKVKIEYDSKIDLVDATLKNCITNNSGQANFDLTRADQIIKNGISNLGLVSYFESLDTTTNTLSNPITNPSNYSYLPDSNTKIVYGKLTTSTGCSSFAKVTLAPTIYTNLVSITFLGTIINDFDGNNNSISINYPGNTNQYKLVDLISGITIYDFQTSANFTNVFPGIYTAFVRDTSTCNQTVNSNPIYVLDYPRFFTPNEDSINDLWTVKNLDLFPEATITIFNRYGKLLKEMSPTSMGWNGTFNGSKLPAADYWFNLTFEDGKIIKGHFSLKR